VSKKIEPTYYETKDLSYINKYFIDPSDACAEKKMENRKLMDEAKRLTSIFYLKGMLVYPKNYIKYPE
tara:strand:- start:90 stop:293 length:204 start_codon:yes stop_codon:yes gene_type:complete